MQSPTSMTLAVPRRDGGARWVGRAARGASPSRSADDRVKRSFDILASASLILMFLPLFVMIYLALRAQGGPVLFSHRRVGRHGRSFGCLKFRTMAQNSDELLRMHLALSPTAQSEWAATQKLKNDPRVTSIGRILRKTSIDELPQLLNVLRGEMSLVGPRPIVQAESHHYGDRIAHYTLVRPGLTGLWQVSGRSDVSYERRVALDCEYVGSYSFVRDLGILLKTVPAVLKSRGSY